MEKSLKKQKESSMSFSDCQVRPHETPKRHAQKEIGICCFSTKSLYFVYKLKFWYQIKILKVII